MALRYVRQNGRSISTTKTCRCGCGRFVTSWKVDYVRAHLPHKSLEARFWAKVDKRGFDECWPWLGAKLPTGYGRIISEDHRALGAHTASYMIYHSVPRPPRDIDICHKCDNPSCVNPHHLFAGTRLTNMQDSVRKGRNARGRRHGAFKHGRQSKYV